MDACARIRGVPLKNHTAIRKETVREASVPLIKGLLRSQKELCNLCVELHAREPLCSTEIHFIGLPSCSEVDDFALKGLPSIPSDLSELLRSLHVQSLKDEEVLLLKDSRNLPERKDSISQTPGSKAICVFRHAETGAGSTSALLSRYVVGMKYAQELQSAQKGVSDTCPVEDDDTNQSVSSIEDDFVTAFEHLEEDEVTGASPFHNQRNQRDAASQTVSPHYKGTSGSRLILSSFSQKASAKKSSLPETPVAFRSSVSECSTGEAVRQVAYTPDRIVKGRTATTSVTESEDSDCSSPSPIIFLDEIGYQKSLRAKLNIPKIPIFKDGVEDSDSEVSEFFDSFDQFDDLDQALESMSKSVKEPTVAGQMQRKTFVEDSKCISPGVPSTAMNPHRFDHPTLPANVKKPTPLKPGSLSGVHSDLVDTPRQVRAIGDETGALFSPVQSSAFSPLGECCTLEYFWKAEGDEFELRKPQDLCALYKTYSDFANNLSKEILGSVCGYSSPVDMNVNKNLSCVCHKEFKNSNGHLMKLSDIQQTVTISKSQKSQTLKDGIQKFATDLVEMSLGSAFRDLQKGVSSCTTTLCHLAARLTSSVFQMAFHEIGMRRAYVLKERAINGLASFLVGEAISGALKEFHFVKKQIFNNTVARFAADLAEELVFEGIMEVCQFSHPSTPLTPSNWSFEQEEEVVSSYATDLSESVLQEAFIELSQADVTFTTQAAISVSLDNIHYVRAEDATEITKTCNASAHYLGSPYMAEVLEPVEHGCTVRKALFCMSGIASCVPVPVAGKAISQFKSPGDTCLFKSSICQTSQTGPRKCNCSEGRLVTTSALELSTATQTDLLPAVARRKSAGEMHTTEAVLGIASGETFSGNLSFGRTHFQHYSGNKVDVTASEACELANASKANKRAEDCAENFNRKTGSHLFSSGQMIPQNVVSANITDSVSRHVTGSGCLNLSRTIESDCFLTSRIDRKSQAVPSESDLGMSFKPQVSGSLCSGWPGKYNNSKSTVCQKKGGFLDHASPLSLKPNSAIKGICQDSHESEPRNECQVSEAAPEIRPTLLKDTLEVPSFEASRRGGKKMSGDDTLTTGRKIHGVPGTPPSTPQLSPPVSQEKHFKKFSKKLKGKLAKEFSPATPPSTPHYQHAFGPVEAGSDSEKSDFLLKLMRSLSEEAEINQDAEDGQDDHCREEMQEGDQRRQNQTMEIDQKIVEKGAFCYAERLACHIVSMATEMDTLVVADGWKSEKKECKDDRSVHSAKFSEQTLNSLWTYAGEIAGEVISDVKKMISSNLSRHKVITSTKDEFADVQPHQISLKGHRIGSLAQQSSSDFTVSFSNPQVSGPAGLSSKNSSCESVTDEYSGYLIRVLKGEGGNRELILDQYASRLAYRSIKSGLAHAARKIKQKSNWKFHTCKRQYYDGIHELWPGLMKEASFLDDHKKLWSSGIQCTCQNPEDMSRREYLELVNFAETLAYNITSDVTRKLRLSSVRLPKSLTDSCLYKKSNVDNVTENLVRTNFSCSFTGKTKQYHSTSSLNDVNYSESVRQVIEHYARKIVDDTLEITLASVSSNASEDKQLTDQSSYAEKLSEATLSSTVSNKTCHYCGIREHLFCRNAGRRHFQDSVSRQRREFEVTVVDDCKEAQVTGLEIPKIHIDMEKRAAFAEEMVSSAIEKAKRELSSASLNADSGIGHDGASFAESLTTEIMTSAVSNLYQSINLSTSGKEATHTSESTASQQLSLSVGDDSIGSWSNLSFEEEHADESSSFLHLSDSNGNSSSWSSLGLEGEIYEEHLSFSPSDSDGTDDKETEAKEDSEGPPCADGSSLVVSVDALQRSLDPQVRAMLQWIAASHSGLPAVQLRCETEQDLRLLPEVLHAVRERDWKVGELLQALLRYSDESGAERHTRQSLFQWLLDLS